MCREKAGGQDEMRMLRAMYAEGEERLGRRNRRGRTGCVVSAGNLSQVWIKAHYYMEPDRRMEQSVHRNMKKVVNLRAEHIPFAAYYRSTGIYGAWIPGQRRCPDSKTGHGRLVGRSPEAAGTGESPEGKVRPSECSIYVRVGVYPDQYPVLCRKGKNTDTGNRCRYFRSAYALQKKIWICWKKTTGNKGMARMLHENR